MGTPEPSASEKRLIELTFSHWKQHGYWPEQVKVMALLMREGMDRQVVNSPALRPLTRNIDLGRVIELTLPGVAVAEGGDAWTSPFVPLVRRGVELSTWPILIAIPG